MEIGNSLSQIKKLHKKPNQHNGSREGQNIKIWTQSRRNWNTQTDNWEMKNRRYKQNIQELWGIMTKDQIMIIEEWFHAKSIENIFNKTLTENFPKSQI